MLVRKNALTPTGEYAALAAAHAERAAFGFLIQNHDDQGDHHHQMDRQNNLRHFSPSLTRSCPSAGARRSIPPRFYTMTAGAQSPLAIGLDRGLREKKIARR